TPGGAGGRDVGELARAVREPAQVATGGAVLEVELDLADAKAGARGIDRHRGLHAEARRERQHGLERRAPQGTLAAQRRGELEAGPPADERPRGLQREAEPPADASRERGDGDVAAPGRNRLRKR